MKKGTGLLLLVVSALVGVWVVTAGDEVQALDVAAGAIPGRYEIRYLAAPGETNTRDRQVLLLDTATGQTWGMRDWKKWEELPRTEAP